MKFPQRWLLLAATTTPLLLLAQTARPNTFHRQTQHPAVQAFYRPENVNQGGQFRTQQPQFRLVQLGGILDLILEPLEDVLGGTTVEGTVTLASPAGQGGVLVELKSSDTTIAQVPLSIRVPEGATSVNFDITTFPQEALADVTITAQVEDIIDTQILTVLAPNATVSVSDATVTEGDNGSVNATFTVTLSQGSLLRAPSVDFTTVNGTAIAGQDYTATSGNLSFALGQTQRTITVPVLGDLRDEDNETFQIRLSNPDDLVITDGTGVGTIVDNDAPPTVSVNNASTTEADTATKNLPFTVSLSAASGKTVTVKYATGNGTAIAGSDFNTTSGTLTFTPGQVSKTVNVVTVGDKLDENDETFVLNLSSPGNATLGTSKGVGTITDNDAAPSLTIASASVTEGNSGAVNADFKLTLSAASGRTASVKFATANGTATAGSDYNAASGTISFAPGQTTKTIRVSVRGDVLDEADEAFVVNLTDPVNLTLRNNRGNGSIIDDDAAPTISASNVSVREGNTGTVNANFAVRLSAPSGRAISVKYSTANGTALAGSDYTAATGTLNIPAGQTGGTVTVPVRGDTLDENNETFRLTLSTPVNATLGTTTGTGTIVDDDNAPVITVANGSATEGNSGTTQLNFQVKLSAASGLPTSVKFATANVNATAGADYKAVSGTVTIPAGTTAKTIAVPVQGDVRDELNETFRLNLSAPVNATLGTTTATGVIVDDDNPPALTVITSNVREGNSGTALNSRFALRLAVPSGLQATVYYTTANGTATAGKDFTPVRGFVTFAPGETVKPINVPIIGDTLDENNETIQLQLSDARNLTLPTGTASSTILDDDSTPRVTISNAPLQEGNTGTTQITFKVKLAAISGLPVSFRYVTTNATAQAGVDYTASEGTVNIPAGQQNASITVPIIGDTMDEPNEVFRLVFSNPVNTSFATPTATGVIVDDDAGPNLTVADVSLTEGNTGNQNATFTLKLSAASGLRAAVFYVTANGTAIAGRDFTSTRGRVIFNPGETTKTVNIPVLGDTLDENNETFQLKFSNAQNLVLPTAPIIGTVVDDDGPTATRVQAATVTPSISISDLKVSEGNRPTRTATLTVTLSAPTDKIVTVNYATLDGSALQNRDYLGQSGKLTFLPGETSQQIVLELQGDTVAEADEQFSVVLSDSTNADLEKSNGVITIANDDGPSGYNF